MNADLVAFLTNSGLGHWVELIGCLVAMCSALDASLPQPAPGSHWLPVRKIITWLALNLGNAKSATQPSLATWLLRLVKALAELDQQSRQKLADHAAAQQAAQQTVPVVPAPQPPAPPPAAAPTAA